MIPIGADALKDLDEAAVWYDEQLEGAGRRLIVEVRNMLRFASAFPDAGAKDPESPPEHSVRIFRLKRFPYNIVTALVQDRRTAVAIAHQRRKPGYGLGRLQ